MEFTAAHGWVMTRSTAVITTKNGAARSTAIARCSRRCRSKVFRRARVDHDALRKRPRFREVFADFEPDIVGAYGQDDVDRPDG